MRFTPKIAAIAARQAAKLVEWMLLAADRPGVQKSYQTFNAVIQALEHVKNEFRLEPHIDAVLRERQSTETRLYTVRELRANDLLARMVQFKDDPQLKDDDSLTLTKAVGQWPARELFNIWWQHRDVVAEILNTPDAELTDEAKARFHATAEQIEQAVDRAVEPFLPPETTR